MFRTVILAACLALLSGCASNDNQVDPAARAENERLKAEAAALREAVVEQRATLESLKQN
ncbi:hypothetical protein MMIC_P1471 [Mariprofundus micogutta]|uniref:Lipoprotein n=1 Tax=Mariprofundus micogutta TaxID=1921010 RepID=A0A1L8CNM4_9PROT|nr:hypothetical protein [Mariprofundus micogutta]GAV20504.1 hypothetical protein MMIC_P1471 [Mariprofundus micogutta]